MAMISRWMRLFCLLALTLSACDRPQLSGEWLLAATPAVNVESEPAPLKSVTEEVEEEALARRPRPWRTLEPHAVPRIRAFASLRSAGRGASPPPARPGMLPSPVCVRSIPLLC